MPGFPHGNGGGVPSVPPLASVLLWATPRPSEGLGIASHPLPVDCSSSVDLPVMVQVPSSAQLLSLITSFFQQCVHVPSSVVFVIRVYTLKTLCKNYLSAISGRRDINLFVVQYEGLTPGLYTFFENLSGEYYLRVKRMLPCCQLCSKLCSQTSSPSTQTSHVPGF